MAKAKQSTQPNNQETVFVERVIRLDDYRPHPRNYNKHPAAQIERLRLSLRKFGQPRNIVVWREFFVAGHGVAQAAMAEGWETLRANVIPDDWQEERTLAFLAADNELSRLSDPDQAALAQILSETRNFDEELMQAIGYDDQEFEALLAAVGASAGAGGAEAGGANAEPQIEDYPVADLLAPYPYFGGKRGIAGAVWARFGEVDNYVEPFFGSGAMLLSRPNVGGIETINDLDGYVANFWRAVQSAPDEVAKHVDWPVSENDLFARHLWLVQQRGVLTERLHADPDYFDATIAGWWCWGACNWIGTGWCDGDGPWAVTEDGEIENRKLPHLGNAGRGVNRKLPHLGDAGRGDGTEGQCVAWRDHLRAMMGRLSDRLRRVRVCSGDWSRVVAGSVTFRHGVTAVFLDPPYAEGAMEYSAGGNDDKGLTDAVRAWCLENGDNPELRIAFCGYEPLVMPAPWRALRWTARKGYQNAENEANRRREIIWFNQHCLEPN